MQGDNLCIFQEFGDTGIHNVRLLQYSPIDDGVKRRTLEPSTLDNLKHLLPASPTAHCLNVAGEN